MEHIYCMNFNTLNKPFIHSPYLCSSWKWQTGSGRVQTPIVGSKPIGPGEQGSLSWTTHLPVLKIKMKGKFLVYLASKGWHCKYSRLECVTACTFVNKWKNLLAQVCGSKDLLDSKCKRKQFVYSGNVLLFPSSEYTLSQFCQLWKQMNPSMTYWGVTCFEQQNNKNKFYFNLTRAPQSP